MLKGDEGEEIAKTAVVLPGWSAHFRMKDWDDHDVGHPNL